MPIVRSAIVRYVGSLTSVWKLSSVKEWTILAVKSSSRQNAEMNSTMSAARYSRTNHAAGGESSSAPRAAGRRCSAPPARRRSEGEALALDLRPAPLPLGVVRAVVLAVAAVLDRGLPEADRVE